MNNADQNQSRPLILNMPHLVSPLNKIISTIVTVFFWMFFGYLWIPMLTMISGMFGYHLRDEMKYAYEMGHFGQLTLSYAMIVAALGGALLLWALQEYLRFRHSTRRRKPLPVELADLAIYTQMNESDLAAWQTTRRMVAHHAEDGKVVEFDSRTAADMLLSA